MGASSCGGAPLSQRPLSPPPPLPPPLPSKTHTHRFVRDFDPEVGARTAAGVAAMRDLCERALTAGGLHLAEGGRLWAIYRE